MKKALSVFVLILSLASAVSADDAAAPLWVRSGGRRLPFEGAAHMAGFDSARIEANEREATQLARQRALGQLSKKIRLKITSELIASASGTKDDVSTRLTSVVRTSSNLQLTNVDYLIHKTKSSIYALAYVNRRKQGNLYIEKAEMALARITAAMAQAAEYEKAQNIPRAIEAYTKVLPQFPAFHSDFAVACLLLDADMREKAITVGAKRYTPRDVIRWEQLAGRKAQDLMYQPAGNLEDAALLIAGQLKSQGVAAGEMKVKDLLYQESDFSSEFGRYASLKLKEALYRALPASGEKQVLSGQYWETADKLELTVFVQSLEGPVLGSARAEFPASSLPAEIEVKPRNYIQALKDMLVMDGEALAEGRIAVEVWTNRGRNEDSVVFHRGETIQFYFRVNQPAYLQLTYVLAGGMKVLLEESFYIGSDRVDRPVRYYDEFEPAPPFGVERLIVTAFSDRPPIADVVSEEVEGVEYFVFKDLTIYSRTRGLIRKRDQEQTDIKIGEAGLTMTTVEAIR